LEGGVMREPTAAPVTQPTSPPAPSSYQATPSDYPAAPKPSASTAPSDAASKNSDSAFTFLDMKLRIGDRIQLQLPASMGSERHVVKLIGYVENSSVLVTPPMSGSMSLPVRATDKIVARVFTSQTAFAFDSTIERVCKIPYDYLHLLYPNVVQGAVVRSAPRIKTRIITSIAKSNASDGDDKISGVIVNISAQGALICMRQVLAIHSQPVIVSFRINLHEVATDLNIKAVIRNVQTDESKPDSDPMKYQHGVQFLGMQPTDNMILQSLIYQQMVEQPQNLM
jgi:c-di-GMP-binding flagellar brake protein YcgR